MKNNIISFDSIYTFIKYYISKQENSYLKSNSYQKILPPNEYDLKQSELNNFIFYLNNKSEISEKDFQKIKEFSISNGGFLNMKTRRKLFKRIFKSYFFDKNSYDTIWINKTNLNINYKKENLYQKTKKLTKNNKNLRVISADVERSNINKYFSRTDFENIDKLLKKDLNNFLEQVTNFNNNEYFYYQGFHDIAIMFFYLYINNYYYYTNFYQKFSETFLKENLLKNKDSFHFTNYLKLISYFIKILDNSAYEILLKFCEGEASFIISYIICLFTHDVKNIFLQMRIFDYFLFSHPISVIVLSCLICIDEIKKLNKNYNIQIGQIKLKNLFRNEEDKETIDDLNISNFFEHFQKVELDKIDFEFYIKKTEENVKKFDFQKFNEDFKNVFQNWFPLMNKEIYLWKMIQIENEFNKNVNNKNKFYLKNSYDNNFLLIILTFLILLISIIFYYYNLYKNKFK